LARTECLAALYASKSLSLVQDFSVLASFVNSRRGDKVMASSGQVRSHKPHCTQLRSDESELRRCLGIEQRARRARTDARHA
jgi:hypothetical protein